MTVPKGGDTHLSNEEVPMPYYVQCRAWHVFEVPEGSNSELEIKCAERAEQGFLDALCLDEHECPECVEARKCHLRKEARLCADVGCPMGDGDCANGCLVVQDLREIEQLDCLVYKNLVRLPDFVPA